MKKLVAMSSLLLLLSACNSTGGPNLTSTQKAAITGAAVGAGVGALSNSKKRGKGAVIGAAAGGIIGGAAAKYGEDQARPRQQYY